MAEGQVAKAIMRIGINKSRVFELMKEDLAAEEVNLSTVVVTDYAL